MNEGDTKKRRESKKEIEAKNKYKMVITDEIARCFEKKIPMPHIYEMLGKIYPTNRRPFWPIISSALSCYSDDQIKEYMNTVINLYVSALSDYREGYIYIQDIMNFTFGHYFSHNTFSADVRIYDKETLKKSESFRMKSLILRAAWPYIYMNYYVCHDSMYKTMCLTDEEIEEYDRKYYSNPRRSSENLMDYASMDFDEVTLPAGSTCKDVKKWIKDYLQRTAVPKRIIPVKKEIYKDIRSGDENEDIIRDLRHMIENSIFRRRLSQIIDAEANRLTKQFAWENDKEIVSEKDNIIVYIPTRGGLSLRRIDSSFVGSERLREEIRIFRRTLLKERGVTSKIIQMVNKGISVLDEMNKDFGIEKCADIEKADIYLYLHEMQNKGYSPLYISDTLGIISYFIKSIQIDEQYEFAPVKNPALGIHFMGKENFVKNHDIIPEDIIVFIDEHIGELDEDIQIIYQLLRVTLWRFTDLVNVRVDGISVLEYGKYASIKTSICKTRAKLRKSGAGDTYEDVIPWEIYLRLMEHIKKYEAARKSFNTDLVFFQGRNNIAKSYSPLRFNDALNGLLLKYGIRSINEKYIGFTSGQLRATGATLLVEHNVPLPVVQNKLVHLNKQTTAKFYARVRREQIAELNDKFFEEQFGDLLDESKRGLLTINERKKLYQEFSLRKAKLEMGECTDSICSNDCERHGSTADCAVCPKLVTGPQYLQKWREIKEASDKRLEEIVLLYQRKEISADTYTQFPEYKKELRDNNAYCAVIDRINAYSNGE